MHLRRLQWGGGGGCQKHNPLPRLHHRNSSLLVTGVSDSCLLSWSADTLAISRCVTVVDSQSDGGGGGLHQWPAAASCVSTALPTALAHLLKKYLFIFASLQDRSPFASNPVSTCEYFTSKVFIFHVLFINSWKGRKQRVWRKAEKRFRGRVFIYLSTIDGKL